MNIEKAVKIMEAAEMQKYKVKELMQSHKAMILPKEVKELVINQAEIVHQLTVFIYEMVGDI